MKALLILEDGWSCQCESFTGEGEVFGEIVFNTGMTGYQEIITDPSYHGQIVVMTSTMVGNYGIREYEDEAPKIYVEGFVVREYSGEDLNPDDVNRLSIPRGHPFYEGLGESEPESPHHRIISNLASYLAAQGVLGVEGVDTRALTKHIRDKGAMRAGISTITLEPEMLLSKVVKSPGLVGRNLVREVTTAEPYLYSEGDGARIAVVDCGVKVTTLRELAKRGCRVEVFPAGAEKSDIMGSHPDGLLLSNGPGDPAPVEGVTELVDKLLGEVPIFGICLGHQMIARALGGKTFKLKFGHHGSNHPVRDERTGKVYITTQNHGFNVAQETLPAEDVELTFINLNDGTLEGLRHKKYPVFSVQFHPEAGPGPHDTRFLFDEFIAMVRK
ncbi:MAG: glutamine-hydrolyzing carbamoyl-phosphate synthase small subunit [Spirochaetota bacterium]